MSSEKVFPKGIEKTIRSLGKYLKEAESIFYQEMSGHSGYEYPDEAMEWYIEKAFNELLILIESLGLTKTYKVVEDLYDEAKSHKEGLKASEMGEYDPFLIWPGRIRDFIDAIAHIHNVESLDVKEITQLTEILENTVNTITDDEVFDKLPENEADVHIRIETILRAIYPNLIHKPALTKPIKNFIPDTGIPSLRTLIEYKFISDQKDAKRAVDEIFADRVAYKSRDWKRFIFVIYETKRIKHKKEWEQLIEESDVAENTKIVVLPGVPKSKKRSQKS